MISVIQTLKRSSELLITSGPGCETLWEPGMAWPYRQHLHCQSSEGKMSFSEKDGPSRLAFLASLVLFVNTKIFVLTTALNQSGPGFLLAGRKRKTQDGAIAGNTSPQRSTPSGLGF